MPDVEKPKAARPAERRHNWQFNEAVLISVLVRHFGDEQYPLGRVRYTKLSYLFHRHEDGRAEGYLKKAAGPYNPSTRYGGPEKIALKMGTYANIKAANVKASLRALILMQLRDTFLNGMEVKRSTG